MPVVHTAPPSRRRAAAWLAAASYLSTAFGILTNLLLVPVYLRYFTLETYGAWLASGGVVFMLSIIDGGLTTIILQRLSAKAGANDAAGFAEVAGSGWILNGCVCAGMMAVGCAVAPYVPAWINAPIADWQVLRVGVVYASCGSALTLAQNNLLSFAQARQRTEFIVVTTAATLVVGVSTTLVGLWSGAGVAALGLAMLCRGAVGFAMALAHAVLAWPRQEVPWPRPARAEMLTQLKIMVPAFLGRTGGALLYYGEPTFVSAFMGPTPAAVLSLTNKVYGVCLTLLNPLANGALSGLAHLAKSPDQPRTRDVVDELGRLSSTGAGLVMGMALGLNKPFLQAWVGNASYGGLAVSATLCAAALMVHRLNLWGAILPALGVIGPSSLGAGVEGVVHLGLLYLLLPRMGLVGVPLATFCGGLLTNAWWFPALLARRLALPFWQGVRLAMAGAHTLGLGLGAGLLVAVALEHAWPAHGGWTAFVGVSVVGAGVIAGSIWLQSATARQLVTRAMR